jgi:hypothetical protein
LVWMVHKMLNTSKLAKYQISINDFIFSPSISFMNHTIKQTCTHIHTDIWMELDLLLDFSNVLKCN